MDFVDLTGDSPAPARHVDAGEAAHPSEWGPDQVLCDECGRLLGLEELDSHCLAHELERDASPGLGGAPREEELEAIYFKELQERYGFADKTRPGSCFICGEEGHWARECARAPDNIQAAQRVVANPTAQSVAAAQRPEAVVERGLVPLLATCLEGQSVPARTQYSALLCGPLDHFQSSAFDSGWGCGFRNTMIQISHLLATCEAAQSHLLGGCNYVPDIISLQAWIECAWAAGFDVQGAEQLGRSLQGSRKWIGTTECATLLQFFGVRARIIDFGVQTPPAAAGAGAGPAAAAGGGGRPRQAVLPGGAVTEVHINVECDGCGVVPIVGARYKSQVLPNYDLCGTCHAGQQGSAAAPFQRMMASRMGAAPGPRTDRGSAPGPGLHEALISWVWRYFNAAPGGEGDAADGAKRQRLVAGQPRVAVRQTARPPLYFQHQGHSRTIVGIERRATEAAAGGPRLEHTLLVLDPGHNTKALAAALRAGQGWQRMLRRGQHTLRADQYQLLYSEPGVVPERERGDLKVIRSHERY